MTQTSTTGIVHGGQLGDCDHDICIRNVDSPLSSLGAHATQCYSDTKCQATAATAQPHCVSFLIFQWGRSRRTQNHVGVLAPEAGESVLGDAED